MSFLRVLQRPQLRLLCRTRGYANSTSPALAPAAPAADTTPKKKAKKTAASPGPLPVESSCAPDTVLQGLNYLKSQPPVLALPDDQYPEWLWATLKPKVYPDDGPGGKAERVQRRLENKRRIKDRNFMSTQ